MLFFEFQLLKRKNLERRWRHCPKSKLARTLRGRFKEVIHSKPDSWSKMAQKMCGISLAGLRAHLEAKFQPGMTWENYGFEGWHIDHVRPLASFDLSDETQQKAAFHYSNLQPLWKLDNLRKGAKFV